VNWIADAGRSGSPMRFSFFVDSFEPFQVVVSTVDLD
jgi:hypothetical protein